MAALTASPFRALPARAVQALSAEAESLLRVTHGDAKGWSIAGLG